MLSAPAPTWEVFFRIAGLKSIAVSLEGSDELLETLWDFILHVGSDLDQNRGLLQQQLARPAQDVELVTIHIQLDERDRPIDAVFRPHLLQQSVDGQEARAHRRLQCPEMFRVSAASAALERPARIEMSILFSLRPIGARGQGGLHQNEP